MARDMTRDELIDSIGKIEWEMFSNVNSMGGKASCQSDPEKFDVMRRCNLLTWPDELLESYRADLDEAVARGANLMSEKYARMMEVTMPGAIDMPPIPTEKRRMINEISDIVLAWEEEAYARYAVLRQRGRSLRQADVDASSISGTAFETYLFGELSVESLGTLRRYLDFVRSQHSQGINGSLLVYENMARLMGWSSLDAAEENFKKAGAHPQGV